MQLRPNQLAAHLKQGLAPIYVVAGEEPLLIQESLDALRAAARAQGYSERQVFDADKAFEWSQLTEATASLSLFASRRLFEVNLPSGAPGDAGGKALKDIAAQPIPDTIVVLVCGPLEYRSRTSAWYSAIEQKGASLYIWPVKAEELPGWTAARLKAAGLSAHPEAVDLLVHRTEGNLLALAQDVEKLKLLHPGETIDVEMVRAAVADSARFDAFDLTEKVLLGDAVGALRSLDRLREEGVDLLELLGAWSFMLRQWSRAAFHYRKSRNGPAACEAAGIFSTRQGPYLKALARVSSREVFALRVRAAAIDLKGKSTGGEPAGWEELVTSILAASRAAP